MDREQEEMQFLGLFGIYAESCKIIYKWRKIFSQITLALILPLSFIFLAHQEISQLLFWKIRHHEYQYYDTHDGTQKHKLADVISSERVVFWLFKFAYFTFLLVFSLLSTSAVVYTIACIYTARPVTFKKVMSVVPKVWKRLMVTFLCTFFTFFVYNVAAALTLILWSVTIADSEVAGLVVFIIILILYVVGFVYMTIVWQLASVISVLEDSYGFKAMVKSKNLIKGKIWIAIVVFFMLNFSLLAIQILFQILVVYGASGSVMGRVGFGILCLLLLLKLFLFGLVLQTVIYFVCKSYHHENIDKSSLSDHLEVYLGEYVPLKAKDVQLEQFQV